VSAPIWTGRSAVPLTFACRLEMTCCHGPIRPLVGVSPLIIQRLWNRGKDSGQRTRGYQRFESWATQAKQHWRLPARRCRVALSHSLCSELRSCRPYPCVMLGSRSRAHCNGWTKLAKSIPGIGRRWTVKLKFYSSARQRRTLCATQKL
jgi:hypothetical protein